MTDVSTFLDSAGGSKYPAFKFENIGDTLAGEIIDTPKIIQRPNLNDGTPEDNLVINIRTTDGHEFTLWVRRGFLAGAISDAVKAAGAAGLEAGGKLGVRYTESRDTGKPKPARVFTAQYQPPTPPTVNPADIFG